MHLLASLVRMTLGMLVGTLIVIFLWHRADGHACAPAAATSSSTGATVVDVARGVEVGMLARIVQIAGDERIVAIDDQPVENDIAAGAAIAHRTLGANTYLDLTVASPRGKRRVLVLMH
jgi:hypothetical protein